MEIGASITSLIFAGIITWQDFKSRLITAWLLPALGITLLIPVLMDGDLRLVLEHALINVGVLALIGAVLTLTVSARRKEWTNIIDTQIGLGDVLLLVCLAPAFSPLIFCLLFTLGAVLALIGTMFTRLIGDRTTTHIPLAGYYGILLCALVLLQFGGIISINTSDDGWLTEYLILHAI